MLSLGLAKSNLNRTLQAKETASPSPIFPKTLAPGDTVMIVAPAKYLDQGRVALAKQRLEKMGFKVKIPQACSGSGDSSAAQTTRWRC